MAFEIPSSSDCKLLSVDSHVIGQMLWLLEANVEVGSTSCQLVPIQWNQLPHARTFTMGEVAAEVWEASPESGGLKELLLFSIFKCDTSLIDISSWKISVCPRERSGGVFSNRFSKLQPIIHILLQLPYWRKLRLINCWLTTTDWA